MPLNANAPPKTPVVACGGVPATVTGRSWGERSSSGPLGVGTGVGVGLGVGTAPPLATTTVCGAVSADAPVALTVRAES